MKKASKSKPRKSYKDLYIVFLTEGSAAASAFVHEAAWSSKQLRIAIRSIVESGVATGDFLVWAKKHEASRGRRPPVFGEKRGYRVQQVKNDPLFVRLTVAPLKVQKGDVVEAYFEGPTTERPARIVVYKSVEKAEEE